MIKALFGMRSALILMAIFAISIGIATFIEAEISTTAARMYVYNAHWLELVMVVLTIILVINLFTLRLFKISKLPSLTFHLSFILIAIGALITRYYGFEGTIHLREGEAKNQIALSKYYIKACKENGECKKDEINEYDNSNFLIKFKNENKPVEIRVLKYSPSLVADFTPPTRFSQQAKPLVALTLSNGKDSAMLELFSAESVDVDGVLFSLDAQNSCKDLAPSSVCFGFKNGAIFMRSSHEISTLNGDTITPNLYQILNQGELYRIDKLNFSLKKALENGIKTYKEVDGMGDSDGFLLSIKHGDKSDKTWLTSSHEGILLIDGTTYTLNAAQEMRELDFAIRLDSFRITRYPGSSSPSGYFSDVSILSGDEMIKQAKIYSNNVLDYGGYRFFQTSYDKDERGSLLSVNLDPGREITYAGYALLCLGLILNLLNKNSRFRTLLARQTSAITN